MLRTFREHLIRKCAELNGLWQLTVQSKVYPAAVPGAWEQIPALKTYRGQGTYTRSIEVQQDANLRFVFKGVSHTADVFLDGQKIGHHYNPYTPFAAVVPHVKAGSHTLSVIADNHFSEDSALSISNDYYTYGGITRGVGMEAVSDVYIQRLAFTPKWVSGQWQADVASVVQNCSDQAIAIRLKFELAGQYYESASLTVPAQGSGEISWQSAFKDVQPWTPKRPTLYYLQAQLLEGEQPIDDLIDRVGFRTIEASPTGLKLNGERLFLKGINRHEEYGAFGSAVPFQGMVQDIQYFKDLGVNAVRTCHYPNDELFLDLCDELGILVWEENHARGLSRKRMDNPNFDWQIKACNEDMVRNHYNHPSIIIWGLLNECDDVTPKGRSQYAAQYQQIRQLDTSRPVTHATCHHFESICEDLPDIFSFNLYPGWYEKVSPKKRLEDELAWGDKAGAQGKPAIVSEFGAGAIYGDHDPFGQTMWSEEKQAQVIADNLNAYLNNPRVTGAFLWQYADCRVSENDWEMQRPRGYNNKGIVDEYRRPKLAYQTVKNAYKKQ